MVLSVVRVKDAFRSFDAFDGRKASPDTLRRLAAEKPNAPVLIPGSDEDRVVRAERAWKDMDWIDTSRERRDERVQGIHFETNLPPDRSHDVWSYIFDRLEK